MRNRSEELLKTALEMEIKGKAFYDKATATCKSELGREIFAMLAKDEVVHVERIKNIYNSLETTNKWTSDWQKISKAPTPINTIFKDLVAKHKTTTKADTSDLEALDVGIDLETKAVSFYENQLKSSNDPLEKVFSEKMIAEEKSHLAVLIDTKLYLENPAAYYVEMERPGFDRG